MDDMKRGKNDMVHSPNHYKICDVEVIDIIDEVLRGWEERSCNSPDYVSLSQGYYLGNVIKYILRSPNKNGIEDLKKAKVYLDWILERS